MFGRMTSPPPVFPWTLHAYFCVCYAPRKEQETTKAEIDQLGRRASSVAALYLVFENITFSVRIDHKNERGVKKQSLGLL